jgi:hypothetical protein
MDEIGRREVLCIDWKGSRRDPLTGRGSRCAVSSPNIFKNSTNSLLKLDYGYGHHYHHHHHHHHHHIFRLPQQQQQQQQHNNDNITAINAGDDHHHQFDVSKHIRHHMSRTTTKTAAAAGTALVGSVIHSFLIVLIYYMYGHC